MIFQRNQSKKPLLRKKVDKDRKVVVIPVTGGKLSSHFGHCEKFAFIVETMNGKIIGTEMRTPPLHESGVIPRRVNEQGVDVIIAAGMRDKARQLFAENHIVIITGAAMDTPENLTYQYLSGTLITGKNACEHKSLQGG